MCLLLYVLISLILQRYFSWESTAEVYRLIQRIKAAPFKTLLNIEVYIWSENISSFVAQHLMWSLTFTTPLLFIITLGSSLYSLMITLHLYHLLPFISVHSEFSSSLVLFPSHLKIHWKCWSPASSLPLCYPWIHHFFSHLSLQSHLNHTLSANSKTKNWDLIMS